MVGLSCSAWSFCWAWRWKPGARRLVQAMTDAVLNRVPVVGGIYNTSKQLVSMLDRQDQADLKGMSVVFCIFGGAHGTGFPGAARLSTDLRH